MNAQPTSTRTTPSASSRDFAAEAARAAHNPQTDAQFVSMLRDRAAKLAQRQVAEEAPARETTLAEKARRRRKDDDRASAARSETPASLAAAEMRSPVGPGQSIQAAQQEMRAPRDPQPQTPRTSAPSSSPQPASRPAAAATSSTSPGTSSTAPRAAAPASPSKPGAQIASEPAATSASKPGVRSAASPPSGPLASLVASGTSHRAGAPNTAGGSSASAAAAGRALGLAEKSLARLAAPSSTPRALMTAEPDEPFAAQLQRGLAAAFRQGGGTVTMRLAPEGLGDLKVRLDMRGSKVAASFEVASESTQSLVGRESAALRSALESKGLEIERLSVHVADQRPAPDHEGPSTADLAPRHAHESLAGANRDSRSGADRDGSPARRHGSDAGARVASVDRRSDSFSEPARAIAAADSGSQGSWNDPISKGGAPLTRLRLNVVA